jgi:hypothetical protein
LQNSPSFLCQDLLSAPTIATFDTTIAYDPFQMGPSFFKASLDTLHECVPERTVIQVDSHDADSGDIVVLEQRPEEQRKTNP